MALVPAAALRYSSNLDCTRQRNCNVQRALVHIVRRPEAGFPPWKSELLGPASVLVVVVEEPVQGLLGNLDPTCL